MLLGPCCHDGISARLIERAGFSFAFMSGFCTAAARLGAPDTGLLSFYEMLDQGRSIHEATRRLPIIGDGDTGYGNAVNVKRTVRDYASAGFAGILIEDQQWPKSCGHVRSKRVVGREEAVMRIRAACDARDEGKDILIAESLGEALWRAAAFADAGADMANMLEGGGKTPILDTPQLEAMGFKLCAYPLSLLGVSVRAMEAALEELKAGRVPAAPAMPSFAELQAAVGFPEYWAEEARYATAGGGASAESSGAGEGGGGPLLPVGGSAVAPLAAADAPAPPPASSSPGVEPDAVVEPGGSLRGAGGAGAPAAGTIDLALLSTSSADEGEEGRRAYGRRPPGADRQARWLRIKISDPRSKVVKLDTRFPAGFLNSVSAFVPAVAGVDLEGLVKQAVGGDWDPSQPVLDEELPAGGDRLQVYLEFA
eukprot:scaffold4.g5056.t1